MKYLATVILALAISLIFAVPGIYAQGHIDPPYLQIQSAEKPITVDGKLDETDWQRRFDHLIFRSKFKPGDVEYGVTGEVLVNGNYKDTTTTIVKILHYGLDLYIALQSNDKYVNKWGNSWEGDGLFMKVQKTDGSLVEYKLYWNKTGANPDINYETTGIPVTSGEGAASKMAGTVVNDTTQVDAGYTAELLIHLDQLGYTNPLANVPVLINIFDPDGQTGTAGEEWKIGSYHKMWWGSEWGPVTRTLRLADPPTKLAIKTDIGITLDGKLDEPFWANADYVIIGKGSNLSSGGYYMQWGRPLNSYTDSSLTTVKFAHKGTDLYVGVQSKDASVCKWSPGWEADGLFLWMTFKGSIPAPGERMEIKAMYFNQTEGASISFETNANVPTGSAEGASFEPAGTVTHTETNGPDNGYSLEVEVHTDLFGYADGDTVKLSSVIWDMDYASPDAFNEESVSDYKPDWWGTQWVDQNFEKHYMYRNVILSDQTSVGVADERPTVVREYLLEQNFPNPFNPTTTIQYRVAKFSSVKIAVFNVLGKKVRTLVNASLAAGEYSVDWDGKDDAGMALSNGVYFYRIETPEFSQTKKMLFIK